MKRETELYPPVKAHLQRLGYEVKGEVGAADVVAKKGDGPPLIVELKLAFSLVLFHQAVERLKISDEVYIAVVRPTGKAGYARLKSNITLCRRLGIGLMTVRARDALVEVHCEPGPYNPRKSKVKTKRLDKEFDRLNGDPNDGGATRQGLVTGYRQDALRCAAYLAEHGASKGAVVAKGTEVPVATRIMATNHYGWFERVEKGVYALTSEGQAGLVHWAYSWE